MDPMLARPITARSQAELTGQLDRMLHSDQWIAHQKCDGHRRAITIDDGQIIGWSRRGEHATLPPTVAAEVERLGGGNITLDGELIDDTLYLFDLVAFGGLITPTTPLTDRLYRLETLMEVWNPDPAAVAALPAARTTDDKIALVEQLRAQGAEGVIFKRADSPYKGLRSSAWVKVKFTHDVDCVVLSFGDEKENMQLGMVDYTCNSLVEVGECTRLAGDGPRVRVGDVVTVKILYSPADTNRLVQPTLPRIRTDKAPGECTIDQLESVRPDRNIILRTPTPIGATP